MADRLKGPLEVRGKRLLNQLGEKETTKIMSLMQEHIRQTIDTLPEFGVIVPTVSLLLERHPNGPSMMVMHVAKMTDDELALLLPRVQVAVANFGGNLLFLSAQCVTSLISEAKEDEISQIEAIKTTIFHPTGIIDILTRINSIDLDKKTVDLDHPMIIAGLGEFDHVFGGIFDSDQMIM